METMIERGDLFIRSSILSNGGRVPVSRVALLVLGCGAFYGAVMGSYSGLYEPRLLQILYSAAKVPLLLLVAFILSLPSFFVFNSLLGLRDDFPSAVRGVLQSQIGLAVVLASFAPFTALWYLSTDDYPSSQLFSLVLFGCASAASQILLRHSYRPLIARDARHRYMMWGWQLIHAFVGIQMAWVLRPFVGKPGTPTEFFREDSWSNAYQYIAELIWNLIGP